LFKKKMPKSSLMMKEMALTPLNARKLMKGMPTVVKADALKGTGVKVFVSPSKHKRMTKAMGKNKGYRLALNQEELDATTEGGKIDLKKLFSKKNVKAGLKAIAKPALKTMLSPLGSVGTIVAEATPTDLLVEKVVGRGRGRPVKAKPVSKGLPRSVALSGLDGMPDEKGGKVDFKKLGRQIKKAYAPIKPIASPIIKELVKRGIQAGITGAVSSIPGAQALGPVAGVASAKLADLAANKLQQEIGFGVRLQSNYSNFLNTMHPAMSPALPPPDNSRPLYERGGSFRAVGKTRGGSIRGSPMNPALPQGDFSMIRKGAGFRAV